MKLYNYLNYLIKTKSMKTKVLSLVSVLFFSTMSLFAQDKADKIKVYGNCGMCETRIEKAVNAIDGVSAADWNKETKMLDVSFDESKTDIHKIHMAVAAVGHDTDMHKADDKVYNALHGCCKYDRPTMKKSMTKTDQSHSGCNSSKEKSASSCCNN